MDTLQLILVALGLLIAAGGIVLLARSLQGRYEGSGTIRPYLPFAVIVVGLVIAYRSYFDYATLDSEDITIMGVFVFALLLLLGLQFFVADKYKPTTDAAAHEHKDADSRKDEE